MGWDVHGVLPAAAPGLGQSSARAAVALHLASAQGLLQAAQRGPHEHRQGEGRDAAVLNSRTLSKAPAQREEPVTVAGRTFGQRDEADIQSGRLRRHDGRHWA